MNSYRLVLLDKAGRVLGNKAVVCDDDDQAIVAAERELRCCEHVEIWNGGNPVRICSKPVVMPDEARIQRAAASALASGINTVLYAPSRWWRALTSRYPLSPRLPR